MLGVDRVTGRPATAYTPPEDVVFDATVIEAHLVLTNPAIWMAEMSDGTLQDLFSFYTDELRFNRSELIGRTAEECRDLHFKKDQAYLGS